MCLGTHFVWGPMVSHVHAYHALHARQVVGACCPSYLLLQGVHIYCHMLGDPLLHGPCVTHVCCVIYVHHITYPRHAIHVLHVACANHTIHAYLATHVHCSMWVVVLLLHL